MSKVYEIKLTKKESDDVIEKRRQEHLDHYLYEYKMNKRQDDADVPPEHVQEKIKNQIVSERENEKTILKALFQAFATDKENEKDLSVFNEMLDNIRQVDDAEDSVRLTKQDSERIRDTFKKMPVQFKTQCFRYPNLMKQIEKPEEVDV
jgi:hypothetical protein